MKKALQISIAKTLFTIEEDAYMTLDAYLASVKNHFSTSEGSEEIVSDIETRIAEQLLEAKESVISIATVERVLAQMGGVNDFDDAQNTHPAQDISKKKLYRNGDDSIIAGVCSGLAAYFGVKTLWVRVAFVIFSFFNGIGILVYIVLWVILPEAKTASQKLEMTGTPITLGTLSETVNERVAELKTHRPSRFLRIVALPFRLLVKLLRLIVGAGFTVFSGAAIVGIMIMSGFMLSGTTWIADEIPLNMLLPGTQHWFIVIAVVLALVIPLIFILLLGVSILLKRSVLRVQAGLGLLAVWFITLLMSGFGAAKVITNYEYIIQTSPSYEKVEQSIPLEGDIDSLVLGRGARVTVVQGTSSAPTLIAQGRAKYINSYNISSEDGVLTVEQKNIQEENLCLFCDGSRPQLTLTVPSLTAATLRGGASLYSDAFPGVEKLSLTLEDGSYADVVVTLESLTTSLSRGSSLSIRGSVASSTISLSNGSSFRAEELKTTDTTIEATRGSYAEVYVRGSLKAVANSGSTIRYSGDAVVTENESGGSAIFSM